jgi:sugar lactone lactonase YvrE
MTRPRLLLDGLKFPEGPRWHDGELWFSDIHAHRVIAIDAGWKARTVVEVPTRPSGLGFAPDGALLIAGMRKPRALYVFRGGCLEVLADLESLPGPFVNDMAVDPLGNAYIGFRHDRLTAGVNPGPEGVALVTPEGAVRIVVDAVRGPNGTVITPDGRNLILAETHGHLLTHFDIASDGSLSNRRLFADTGEAHPDGICLDSEGAIWIGGGREFQRVLPGGQVAARIVPGEAGWHATACVLGGPDRRTLFMLEHWPDPTLGAMVDPELDVDSPMRGRIEAVPVEVAGAGTP